MSHSDSEAAKHSSILIVLFPPDLAPQKHARQPSAVPEIQFFWSYFERISLDPANGTICGVDGDVVALNFGWEDGQKKKEATPDVGNTTAIPHFKPKLYLNPAKIPCKQIPNEHEFPK